MNSGAGDTTQLVPGFPIRTPWDHSSVDSSPRPNAASRVLHRPLVPRQPPSALTNLPTHGTHQDEPQNTKKLASTMQISTHHQPTTSHPPQQAASHAWHQDTNPATHRQRHAPPGRTRLFSQNPNRVST